MRISKSIWGIPIIRSISPETARSAHFPMADAVPRARAASALKKAVTSPSRMLKDRPASVLANISLPSQSVPNRNPAWGGRFFLAKSAAPACSESAAPAAVIKSSTEAEITIFHRGLAVLPGRFAGCLLYVPLFRLLFRLLLSFMRLKASISFPFSLFLFVSALFRPSCSLSALPLSLLRLRFSARKPPILGSTARYKRSAVRFPANTKTALFRVIPRSRGTSLPRPAVTAAWPSPG